MDSLCLKEIHTCEEGGKHLRIYFLTFTDDLKTKYLLKEIVEVSQYKAK